MKCASAVLALSVPSHLPSESTLPTRVPFARGFFQNRAHSHRYDDMRNGIDVIFSEVARGRYGVGSSLLQCVLLLGRDRAAGSGRAPGTTATGLLLLSFALPPFVTSVRTRTRPTMTPMTGSLPCVCYAVYGIFFVSLLRRRPQAHDTAWPAIEIKITRGHHRVYHRPSICSRKNPRCRALSGAEAIAEARIYFLLPWPECRFLLTPAAKTKIRRPFLCHRN